MPTTHTGKCREGRKFILIQTPLPRGGMECKHNINLADGEREREKETKGGGNRGLECLAAWSQPLSHPNGLIKTTLTCGLPICSKFPTAYLYRRMNTEFTVFLYTCVHSNKS